MISCLIEKLRVRRKLSEFHRKMEEVDFRRLLVKEGLKAEESRECFLLRQEVEALVQHIQMLEETHHIEREEATNSYLLEREKNTRLEKRIKMLEAEVADVNNELFQSKTSCRSLADALHKCEKERDELKLKCDKVKYERSLLPLDAAELKTSTEKVEETFARYVDLQKFEHCLKIRQKI